MGGVIFVGVCFMDLLLCDVVLWLEVIFEGGDLFMVGIDLDDDVCIFYMFGMMGCLKGV